jgi:hypothetical protein
MSDGFVYEKLSQVDPHIYEKPLPVEDEILTAEHFFRLHSDLRAVETFFWQEGPDAWRQVTLLLRGAANVMETLARMDDPPVIEWTFAD